MMNLLQPHTTRNAPRGMFLAGAMALLALSNSAQAVVTVTFAQQGPNVTATLSGTFKIPQLIRRSADDASFTMNIFSGGQLELYALLGAPTSYDLYTFGTSYSTGLFQSPDSFIGSASFGYNANSVLVDGSALPGDTISPTGTWTWNNTTIAGIGLGALTTVPVTVHETANLTASDNQDSIQFVLIPEPSASFLLGLGVTSLLFRRRRLA